MSETPWRIVQGFERKPWTLATIGRREGGGRGKVCLLNVDLLKVTEKYLQSPLHTRNFREQGGAGNAQS